MINLLYGYKEPENGDTGTLWFPALANNWARISEHNHDGVDSALLTASSISSVTQSVSSGSWTLDANGIYKQTVTLPSPLTYDNVTISVRLASNGNLIYPTIEKATSNSYVIYINDNSLSLSVLYR